MEDILFKSKKIEISANGPHKLILVAHNHTLANKINNCLDKYYPESIKRGEEPIFKITIDDGLKIAKSCFSHDAAQVLTELIKKHVETYAK